MMMSTQSLLPAVGTAVVLLAAVSFVWVFTYVWNRLRLLDSGTKTERTPLLEDPTSLETVPFPSVYGAAEKYLSLIMPAYNEENRLPGTLDETLAYLQSRAKEDKNFTYEIIIVDDGSTDRTVKVAFDYVKKYKLDVLRVLRQSVNQGKGAAVRKGMLYARGQLLLMLDADGATKITDLMRLEIEIKRMMSCKTSPNTLVAVPEINMEKLSQAPMAVYGSRAGLEKENLACRVWYRAALTKAFHLLVVMVAGSAIQDTQCGFKIFTRAAARQLFLNMRLKRFSFDVELTYLCNRLRIPIREVAVNWTEIPGSKVKISSVLHMAFELVLIRLGYDTRLWKIHQQPIYA